MDNVRERLISFMESNHIKQAHIARATGLSAGYISQFLSQTSNADTKNVEAKIDAFLSLNAEKIIEGKHESVFVNTSVSRAFTDGLSFAQTECEIVVGVGRAGLGKTTTLKRYKLNFPMNVLISANLSYTARDLFIAISEKLGLSTQGSIHTLHKECTKKLSGSGRLVMIDQAEYLPARALDLLRSLYDDADIGMFLCGLPRLLEIITKNKNDYEQLSSRIGLTIVADPIDDDDVKLILNKNFPQGRDCWKRFSVSAGGSPRVLTKLIRRSKNIMATSKLVEMNEKVVDAAKMRLAA